LVYVLDADIPDPAGLPSPQSQETDVTDAEGIAVEPKVTDEMLQGDAVPCAFAVQATVAASVDGAEAAAVETVMVELPAVIPGAETVTG